MADLEAILRGKDLQERRRQVSGVNGRHEISSVGSC